MHETGATAQRLGFRGVTISDAIDGVSTWVGKAASWLIVGLMLLVLVSCGVGDTKPADDVSDVGFRMHGDIANTVDGATSYHFEYGLTSAYGSSTAVRSQVVVAGTRSAVDEQVTGLAEATRYHYRLCAVDVDGHGLCGADTTVTTDAGHDSVVGQGWIILDGTNRIALGSGVMDAHSDADGTNATGRASASPGPHTPFFDDVGDVTCLRVEGNRASIGFLTDAVDPPAANERYPLMVFIEDNGSSGDRWTERSLSSPATSCPISWVIFFLGLSSSSIAICLAPCSRGGETVASRNGAG